MKKFVILSLLVLSLKGLYAYDQLAPELDCEIMRYVPQDPFPIAPGDAVQDVAEYLHDKSVCSVAWSPDGRLIASGGWDGIVKIRDAHTGSLLAEYMHDKSVCSVAWSPDGRRIASGGDDKKVKIADAHTGSLLAEYMHDRSVCSVSWSPDGRLIASGGYDNTVKIADSSGTVLAEYLHGNWVNSVSWSPDGRLIAFGAYDKKVKIKSIVPLLLVQHQLKHSTLSQYLLLKRLQEKLLKEKKPLLIGQSDRETLEGMPDLKMLLKVEKSNSKTTHPIWRLQLKGGPQEQPARRCDYCTVM